MKQNDEFKILFREVHQLLYFFPQDRQEKKHLTDFWINASRMQTQLNTWM